MDLTKSALNMPFAAYSHSFKEKPNLIIIVDNRVQQIHSTLAIFSKSYMQSQLISRATYKANKSLFQARVNRTNGILTVLTLEDVQKVIYILIKVKANQLKIFLRYHKTSQINM
ncbi:hypothetical protein TTHERM_00066780 (macronuclear) [Tetrahymena thermophila SB210]|uniref:Uncharacterized protein n=1 Tax=Tetrahymena thermophila (strain SB210) TaxID=312017 RepID=I7M6Y0_TETTS|nr:hypothetical protein TTHERM_00066780 [Tetrahymena thermophila SB210]EAR87472.1 hypothetical protein TTHERM_00066780 [Tetrahymena thermophila SB210]|eukprot:XP_001007717.1 hypothetical protein TTHERM_00066780 [Tetrahymena thermophila SB210]